MGVVKTSGIIVGFGGLGIIIAAIMQQLNERGIFVDEMITGSITIADLMIIIVLLFLLVGVILAAWSK